MTIILGVDPGSRITGYGLINYSDGRLSYVASGCVQTKQGELADRLLQIHDGICEVIREYSPTTAAIEEVFMHKNASSALKLGHARGVAMVAMASHCLSVSEYSARKIKQSVVGYGGAEKEQVKQMVLAILGLSGKLQTDAADGLAVAICHCNFSVGLNPYIGLSKHTRGRIK